MFFLVFLAVFLALWGLFLAAAPPTGHLLARVAHFAAKFRYRDYVPVAVVLAAGLSVTAMAGGLFIEIAERVSADTPEVRAVDTRAHQWAALSRTPGSTAFFVAMTTLGSPVVLAAAVALTSGALALRGRFRWAAYLVLTAGAGGLLNLGLKALFARSRPELAEALRTATGYSFPSGHAMGSTIVCAALAYLALRSLRRWSHRSAVLALATSMALAISFSRVYLCVHWISDVGAGVAAGLIWVMTTTVAYETFRRIRLVRALRAKRGIED